MFNRYDGCHTITDIRSGKVRILILQDTQFSGILIHHCGKCCLKSGQMGSALCVIDIITEAKYIFMELIDILKRNLDLNAFCCSPIIHRFMDDFFLSIQIADKANDTVRLVIFDMFGLFSTFIFIYNC